MNVKDRDLVNMNRVLRHRLRNLAAGMSAATTLLGQGLQDRLKPEEKEYFPLLLQACDQIIDITNRLNALFDEPPPGPPREAAAVVRETMFDVRQRFPTANLELEVAAGDAARLTAPEDLLRVALREVLTNAVEASAGRTIVVRQTASGGRLRLSVRDQGPGVPPEARAQMRRPFFTTREHHLGVGLVLAQRAVRRLGGRLAVAGAAGGGLAVSFTLPACPPRRARKRREERTR
jgi:signal transduction histidine kinase